MPNTSGTTHADKYPVLEYAATFYPATLGLRMCLSQSEETPRLPQVYERRHSTWVLRWNITLHPDAVQSADLSFATHVCTTEYWSLYGQE